MTRCFSCLFIFASLLLTVGPLHADTANAALAKAAVLESNVAYLRVGQVAQNLASEISASQRASATTNQIIGTVLDLRFADGTDLAAAKATASLFTSKKLPLTILVNGKTQGAAAALATTLREGREGLIFGSMEAELKPDIAVRVSEAEERVFLKNPYAALALSATNSASDTNSFSPFIDHTSEADLVRAKIKDGEQDEDSLPARPAEPQKPFIHDPVLARAVDLIKALAVVRPSHS